MESPFFSKMVNIILEALYQSQACGEANMWSSSLVLGPGVVLCVSEVLQPTTCEKHKIYTKPLSSSESDCDGVLISDMPAINVTNRPGRDTPGGRAAV